MRTRIYPTLAVLFVIGCLASLSARTAWALAGTLDRPSISIPTVEKDGKSQPDPIVQGLYTALTEHAKQFASGRFINAHSVMEFTGDTAALNALLKDLAAVEGATLQVRFAQSPGQETPVKADGQANCQWQITHNAWVGDPQQLSITIYLADGKIKIDELALPAITGKQPNQPAAPESTLLRDIPVEKKP